MRTFINNMSLSALIRVNDADTAEFYDCISDLLMKADVIKLDDFVQHIKTTRLVHSLNVSYLSYKIVKWLKLDFNAVSRSALLHDLFLYDRNEIRKSSDYQGNHAFVHPKVALVNAKRLTKLSGKEENIILSHMFPLSTVMPKSREALIVTLVDKYCAVKEAMGGILTKKRLVKNEVL